MCVCVCVNSVPYGFPMTTRGTFPVHADTEGEGRGDANGWWVGWGEMGKRGSNGRGRRVVRRVFATCGI